MTKAQAKEFADRVARDVTLATDGIQIDSFEDQERLWNHRLNNLEPGKCLPTKIRQKLAASGIRSLMKMNRRLAGLTKIVRWRLLWIAARFGLWNLLLRVIDAILPSCTCSRNDAEKQQ